MSIKKTFSTPDWMRKAVMSKAEIMAQDPAMRATLLPWFMLDEFPGETKPVTTVATISANVMSTSTDIVKTKRELRRELREAYRFECKRAGVRVTDEMIAQAANSKWTSRANIQKWLACDPKYNGRSDDMIRAVFLKKPHLS
jgi:hypothetical protein